MPTHILLGAIIGKVTGDPVAAIAVSVLVDVDHLYSYAKHKVLFTFKKFWKVVTDQSDPYGDQRGYLHNIIIAAVISALSFFVSKKFGIVFSSAYFGHLLLDMLDTSDYFIFYPSTTVNVKGFIDYYSKGEVILDVALVVILISMFFV